jgi:hypothetical protein
MKPEEKKELKRLYDIEYRAKNKEKIANYKKTWVNNNPDKIEKSRVKNKENKKKLDKNYAIRNKELLNEKKKKWAKENKDKVRLAKTKYFMNKLQKDPLFKLKHNIGCAIRLAFKRKGYSKKNRTYIILGCSYDEFKLYLESKFEPWMNWDNHGNYNGIPKELNVAWDIDHIIPISSAKTEEDVMRLSHYTNFQPLCSYTNRWVKSNN